MISNSLEQLTYTEYLLLPLVGVKSLAFGTLIQGVVIDDKCEWIDIYCMKGLEPQGLPDYVYMKHNKNTVNIHRILVPDNVIPDVVLFLNCNYKNLSQRALENIEEHTCLPIDGQSCEFIYTHIYILALRRDPLVHDFVTDIDGEYLEPHQYTVESEPNYRDRFPYSIPIIKDFSYYGL